MQAQARQRQSYLWIAALTSILFLFFFRARWGFVPILAYDDQCYLEWLHKFLSVPYPRCYSTSHLPGTAILWIPTGWFARFLSFMTSVPLKSWLEPLIGMQSFLTWGICLFLIFRILSKTEWSNSFIKRASLILLLCIPVLDFVGRATFSTHPAELLLSLFLVLAVTEHRWITALIACVLLNLTRINDLPAFLLIAGAFWDAQANGALRLSARTKSVLVISLGILFAGALIATLYVGLVTGYNGTYLSDLFPRFSFSRWERALIMGDSGLLWSVPAGLLGFVVSLRFLNRLSWLARAGLVWMVLELGLVVALNEYRSDYPFPPWRYLIGAMAGMIPALMETYRHFGSKGRALAQGIFGSLAVWQFYLAFVANSFTTLSYWKTMDGTQPFSFLHYIYLLRDPSDLVKLFFLAPVGYSIFSWRVDSPAFAKYSQYAKYAIHGPGLYLLTLSSGVALMVLGIYLSKRWQSAGGGGVIFRARFSQSA